MQAIHTQPSSCSSSPPAKRRKATRACDPCRSRKLRCDYDLGEQTCRSCTKSGSQCVSSQPAKIDKRRLRTLVELAKTDEQKRWVASQVAERGIYIASTDKGALRKARPSTAGDPMALIAQLPADTTSWMDGSGDRKVEAGNELLDVETEAHAGPSRSQSRRGSGVTPNFKTTGVEPRHQGPTASINLLRDLNDQNAVAKHDQRYGLFRVADEWVYGGNTDELMREGQLVEQLIRDETKDQLISFYIANIAPINPVIPPHRVSSVVDSSEVILYSVLGVAALWRKVPSSIYITIRAQLERQLATDMHGSTLTQVRAMLISGMSHELHSGTNMEGGSTAWLRVGSAIRQAQDIGLHRLDVRHWLPEMYAERMWAWLGCIVADNWYAASYGQPLTINLLDCEDPLGNVHLLQSTDNTHLFQVQMYHFSCLLGQTMQTIFRPYALERSTDQTMHSLLDKIDAKIANVPEIFAFHGNTTEVHGGLLNLTIACVETLFFRSFVKLNRKLPLHITFRPTPSRWETAVKRARSAIAWADIKGDALLDCWLPVKYMVTYSALAQYYHYVAERDNESLQTLALAKDVMNRWALGHQQARPVASRSKIADIVNIFHKAALDLTQKVVPRVSPAFIPEAGRSMNIAPMSSEAIYPQGVITPSTSAGTADNGNGPTSTLVSNDSTTLDDWLADLFRQQEVRVAGPAEQPLTPTTNDWSTM